MPSEWEQFGDPFGACAAQVDWPIANTVDGRPQFEPFGVFRCSHGGSVRAVTGRPRGRSRMPRR
jgi:hypothetical protein